MKNILQTIRARRDFSQEREGEQILSEGDMNIVEVKNLRSRQSCCGKGQECTPYGEVWLDIRAASASDASASCLPWRFTGKEFDEETGLYYFGARYLDPKYSRWMSADPAVGEYMSTDAESAKKLSAGGGYTLNNLSLYHYSNNNPIKYVDPDGNIFVYYQSGGLYANPTYMAIPFGGDLTQEQTDAKKRFRLCGLALGR